MSLSVVIHPRNFGWLVENLDTLTKDDPEFDRVMRAPLYHIPVIQSSDVPQFRSGPENYIPPEHDRFVEYGPEDHDWAPAVGIGQMQRYVAILERRRVQPEDLHFPVSMPFVEPRAIDMFRMKPTYGPDLRPKPGPS